MTFPDSWLIGKVAIGKPCKQRKNLAVSPAMELWQSVVLGVIEGLTEYLPVSSTGHLVVAQRMMGIGQGLDKEAADAFAVCIQGGAIVAVLGLYLSRVKQMVMGLMGRDPAGLKLLGRLVVAFMPAMVAALLLSSVIKHHLFGIVPIITAWLVGGVAILWFSSRRREAKEGDGIELLQMTWRMAVIIGVLQCVAMWPGTSRSLMTICAGLLVGLKVSDAVEFSFLLGLLTLTAATGKDALDSGALMLKTFGVSNLVVGFLAATISAAVAVKWLVAYLKKHDLKVFGWYRIAAGVVVTVLLIAGVIHEHAPRAAGEQVSAAPIAVSSH